MKPVSRTPDRQTAGARCLGVDRLEQQRSCAHGDKRKRDDGDDEQREDLAAADAQERPEQQRLGPAEHRVVERQEQVSRGQPDHLNRRDGRRLGAVAALRARRSARPPHEQRRAAAGQVVAEPRGQPGERGARRAGERHHRQRVAGEGLPAQHHVPADDRGQHGDDRARLERVDHERIGEQLTHIGDRVQRELRTHLRPRARAGARDGEAAPGDRPRPGGRRSSAAPRSARRTARSACAR